jgi:predicted PolB exonuclease-like 3'-5' exonuclease
MATLVFDIETSAIDEAAFDDGQLEYLFRNANAIEDVEEREAKRAETKRMFNLWPFTAQCVCICMINADSDKGKVLFLADDYEEYAGAKGTIEYVPCADEAELLAAFWDAARHFDRVVTFNGRGFDVPFLYLRSAALDVPISRKDWLGYRFAVEPHCDLADQLTFYSVGGRDGAARRFNLDFYCKVFGIESPKSHGVTGMDVNDLMAAGRFSDIADYCVRDVEATVALYRIWHERLAGIK